MTQITQEQMKIIDRVQGAVFKKCREMLDQFLIEQNYKSKGINPDSVERDILLLGTITTQIGKGFAEQGIAPYDEVDKILDFYKKINNELRMGDKRAKAFAGIENEVQTPT